uniref:Uncharacterized protein n=1 Tax=Ascaris lumbricoides TaxID=6252 RepID=A0A9J2PBV2_ASCLU
MPRCLFWCELVTTPSEVQGDRLWFVRPRMCSIPDHNIGRDDQEGSSACRSVMISSYVDPAKHDAKVIRGIASESNGYMHQVPLLLLVVTPLLMPGGGDEPTLHTPAQIVPLLLLVVTLLLMPGGGDEPTLHAPAQIGVCASFLIVSGSPRTQMLIRKHLYYNAITKAYRSGLEDTNAEISALLNTRLLKGS